MLPDEQPLSSGLGKRPKPNKRRGRAAKERRQEAAQERLARADASVRPVG